MSRLRSATVVAALALAVTATASAGPSVWTAARDRNALRSERLVEEAERRQQVMQEMGTEAADLRKSIERDAAIASLEAQGAARLPDPRVHFALGQLYYDKASAGADRPADYHRALAELEWVVRHTDDGPMAAEAWNMLSIVYAKLDMPDRIREASARVLDLEPRSIVRGFIYYNRGDLELEAGEFDVAIADYRRAIPLSYGPMQPSLVYWSLGLALERNGDLPAALDAVAMAQTIYAGSQYLSALDETGVFFVPSYEKSYYQALGELACARDAPTHELAIRSYENARTYFEDFILKAMPDKHRGLSNAKLELRMIERRLRALETAPSRPHESISAAIRPGCPRPEVPVPPPPQLQLPVMIPQPVPIP